MGTQPLELTPTVAHLAPKGPNSVQLFGNANMASAPLDSSRHVEPTASFAATRTPRGLEPLVEGQPAAGTDHNGVQLSANTTVACALLESLKTGTASSSGQRRL